MARWIMLGLTILGAALMFSARSVGLLSIGLLFAVFGFFGFVFVLAADRVSGSARPETSMAAADDLAALRKRATLPRPRPSNPASAGARPGTDVAPTSPANEVLSLGASDPSARRQTS